MFYMREETQFKNIPLVMYSVIKLKVLLILVQQSSNGHILFFGTQLSITDKGDNTYRDSYALGVGMNKMSVDKTETTWKILYLNKSMGKLN